MLDIKNLEDYGADTGSGLKRCMNNEDFYLRLVKMAAQDPNFAKLDEALAACDWKSAFEAAHALKGILGNLDLTPIFDPMSKLTEALRPLEECEYKDLLNEIHDKLSKLKEMIEA